MRHDAKKKICNKKGCNNIVKKGGECTKHGATKNMYYCSHDGCPNKAIVGGGVCIRNGAKVERKRPAAEVSSSEVGVSSPPVGWVDVG
mmetsp:Transcript_21920/g.21064  ORF Transcript_21920/g.21064 Transcript_21920/m.21064 type:complete len:88 (-) Transcript_21920:24-287(-)